MSKLIFTRLTLAFMLFLTLGAFKAQGQATIKTDLLDYPPGSTAIITGTGFQPGETVTLQVIHVGDDPLGTDAAYHQPFTTVADNSGNVSSSWDVPTDGDALGATFLLTADGGSSGLHAEWTFTDANTSLTVDNVTGIYGGTVTLTATLKQQGGGNPPISGKTISFTLNGTLINTAVTNASGVATLSSVSLGAINANTYNSGVGASFAAELPTWSASSGTGKLIVNKADQTITWANPANITYGTVLSATQLNATVAGVSGGSAPGALTYTPASGVLLSAGSQTLQVDAAATTNYNAATKQVALVVDKANQTITWANPADITYGTLLGATQLNATVAGSATAGASAPGALTYTPAAGTLLNAGLAQTLSVSAAATTNYNAAGPKTVQINVNKANQTITWANPAAITYGTLLSATQLNATVAGSATAGASAPGALTYTPASGTLLDAGVGQTLSVSAAATSNYNAAGPTTVLITVNKADPTITWANPADITYGTLLSGTQLNAVVTGSATAGATAPGTLTYTPSSGTLLDAGSNQSLVANVASTTNYNAATKTVKISVSKADQIITWSNPANITYGTLLSSTQLNASVAGVAGGSAPGALTYNPVAGTLLNAGTQTLSVSAAPTSNYKPASASVTLIVDKANPTVNVTGYSVTYDGNPHTATYTITGVNGETGATVGTIIVAGTTHTNAGTYNNDPWSFTG
ncbi:hypothetical protein QWZ08_13535, partial [Ferruginibacter paludis]|uniref:beta strand repeat-containing protein n=1 Tax=Ferruginibacter paludis TaxID=1310417 RepID=UPI0025B289F8